LREIRRELEKEMVERKRKIKDEREREREIVGVI
jgi:hypothetical protein